MATNIRINVPQAAEYNRNPEGANAARNEWWNQMSTNDGAQAGNIDAQRYAQGQAQTGTGQQAQVDPRLAGQAGSGANGNQDQAIGLARSLAYGNSPSAAAYQLQRGLDSTTRQQQAIARSGRGSAALATGQATGAANVANAQQNAFTQGGMLRAQDMANGRGMYGTMLGQQREQRAGLLGMQNEMDQFNAQQQDKYRLGMGQAGLQLGQAGVGYSQSDLSNYQQGMNPINAQTEAWQQYQAWLANAQRQKVSTNNGEIG